MLLKRVRKITREGIRVISLYGTQSMFKILMWEKAIGVYGVRDCSAKGDDSFDSASLIVLTGWSKVVV